MTLYEIHVSTDAQTALLLAEDYGAELDYDPAGGIATFRSPYITDLEAILLSDGWRDEDLKDLISIVP